MSPGTPDNVLREGDGCQSTPLKGSLPVAAALEVWETPFELHFERAVAIPAFPVVTLRGLLGLALLAYLHPGLDVPPPDSPYWHVFKPPQGRPHPILLDCPPGAGQATVLRGHIRAFGDEGRRACALCLEALDHAAALGFGSSRAAYRLVLGDERPLLPPWRGDAPPLDGVLRCTLNTPAQLVWKNQPADEHAPIVHVLAWAGIRRLRHLSEAYGAGCTVDADAVEGLLQNIYPIRFALERVREQRRSSYTHQSIACGGLLGWFEAQCDSRSARLLAMAGVTGVGRKVFAGNGRVVCSPAEVAPGRPFATGGAAGAAHL